MFDRTESESTDQSGTERAADAADEHGAAANVGDEFTSTARSEHSRETSETGRGARALVSPWLWSVLLLCGFLLLLTIVVPPLVGRIRYIATFNDQRAKVDVARQGLSEIRLDSLESAFRLVAQGVGPSVVHIHTTRAGPAHPRISEHRFRFELEGDGSGVIVDTDGYILTNKHVIENAESIRVVLSDGRETIAKFIAADEFIDLAVLKIDLQPLIACEWGDSDDLEVGDMVWACGSPYGLQRSITFGILSAKARRGVTQADTVYSEYLQTDAAVNPGNSGGPLVNSRGKVIGINAAIVGPAYRGICFAIPSIVAREIYDELRSRGHVARAFLGIQPVNVPADVSTRLELKPRQGVYVRGVEANSPAAKGGLRKGDVILQWNGLEYSDPGALSRAIAGTKIGSTAVVLVTRGQQEEAAQLELTVTLGDRALQELASRQRTPQAETVPGEE